MPSWEFPEDFQNCQPLCCENVLNVHSLGEQSSRSVAAAWRSVLFRLANAARSGERRSFASLI